MKTWHELEVLPMSFFHFFFKQNIRAFSFKNQSDLGPFLYCFIVLICKLSQNRIILVLSAISATSFLEFPTISEVFAKIDFFLRYQYVDVLLLQETAASNL